MNPCYEICIISYQVNLSSEVSAMFSSLMPSLNSRSLPFVVFLGGFPSRCQNLSSGAIRPGGLLFLNSLDFLNIVLWICDKLSQVVQDSSRVKLDVFDAIRLQIANNIFEYFRIILTRMFLGALFFFCMSCYLIYI